MYIFKTRLFYLVPLVAFINMLGMENYAFSQDGGEGIQIRRKHEEEIRTAKQSAKDGAIADKKNAAFDAQSKEAQALIVENQKIVDTLRNHLKEGGALDRQFKAAVNEISPSYAPITAARLLSGAEDPNEVDRILRDVEKDKLSKSVHSFVLVFKTLLELRSSILQAEIASYQQEGKDFSKPLNLCKAWRKQWQGNEQQGVDESQVLSELKQQVYKALDQRTDVTVSAVTQTKIEEFYRSSLNQIRAIRAHCNQIAERSDASDIQSLQGTSANAGSDTKVQSMNEILCSPKIIAASGISQETCMKRLDGAGSLLELGPKNALGAGRRVINSNPTVNSQEKVIKQTPGSGGSDGKAPVVPSVRRN